MLPYLVLSLRYYLTADGESPFESWFSDLDARAAAKVTVAVARLEQGQPLERQDGRRGGAGIPDRLGTWLPGLFGRDGDVLVILLTGGTKQRQQRDVARAKELWADYKRRRRPPLR